MPPGTCAQAPSTQPSRPGIAGNPWRWAGADRAAGLSNKEIAETIGHVALNVITNYFTKAPAWAIDFPAMPPDPQPAQAATSNHEEQACTLTACGATRSSRWPESPLPPHSSNIAASMPIENGSK